MWERYESQVAYVQHLNGKYHAAHTNLNVTELLILKLGENPKDQTCLTNFSLS